MAYVFGTSSCTMTTTRDPVFVPGVWGPYYSAMIPGAWLNEGGQSAAGAAIDQLVGFHPASSEAAELASAAGQSLPEWLADRAAGAGDLSGAVSLAGTIHVVPEFLGNRAPFADPHARAVIAGLGMERDVDSLVALYIAGLCGLGYGLRQIVETQSSSGAPVESIAISGGAGRHPLIRQLLADATGLPILATRAAEPVLLGSAMLGAVAAGTYPDIHAAMSAMSSIESRVASRSTRHPSHCTTGGSNPSAGFNRSGASCEGIECPRAETLPLEGPPSRVRSLTMRLENRRGRRFFSPRVRVPSYDELEGQADRRR